MVGSLGVTSDPSQFHKLNVADACSIWNILSSQLFYSTAKSAGCSFCCVYYVYYECLYKPRKNPKPEELELQERFREKVEDRIIKHYHLDIEDLQEVEILRKRKNLSKGELASIAFAKKTKQAFLTDDDKAEKLARSIMNRLLVQTTPHLLGWLFLQIL